MEPAIRHPARENGLLVLAVASVISATLVGVGIVKERPAPEPLFHRSGPAQQVGSGRSEGSLWKVLAYPTGDGPCFVFNGGKNGARSGNCVGSKEAWDPSESPLGGFSSYTVGKSGNRSISIGWASGAVSRIVVERGDTRIAVETIRLPRSPHKLWIYDGGIFSSDVRSILAVDENGVEVDRATCDAAVRVIPGGSTCYNSWPNLTHVRPRPA